MFFLTLHLNEYLKKDLRGNNSFKNKNFIISDIQIFEQNYQVVCEKEYYSFINQISVKNKIQGNGVLNVIFLEWDYKLIIPTQPSFSGSSVILVIIVYCCFQLYYSTRETRDYDTGNYYS